MKHWKRKVVVLASLVALGWLAAYVTNTAPQA